ncbi:MAG: orotate phosphoribosyltransferase, partial [Vicingaceae bacterium]
REHGCSVLGMVAIFTYGFQIAENNFKESKCDLVTLSDYNSMLTAAVKANYVTESALESLSEWRISPEKWNAAPQN